MLSHKLSGALDSPAILFLHGFLGAKEDWDPMIEVLEDRFFCLSIDIPKQLEEIASFLKTQQHSRYALVGYSMGGRAALMLQKQFPSLFSHLFLFSAHPGLKSEKEKKEREQEEKKWQEKLKRLPIDAFLDEWYAQPLFESLVKRREFFEKMRIRRANQDIDNLAYFALSKQPYFSSFSVPTHFICGEEDLKYAALYRTLPTSISVKTVAGCGHAIHLENPSACAEIIAEQYV